MLYEVITDIKVDLKMQLKLESLGIRKGALIEKKAKMLGNGPVVVGIGNGEIALAHEVANYRITSYNVCYTKLLRKKANRHFTCYDWNCACL